MKLYYSPGACSLSDHIALHEAGLSFDHEKVDLKAKTTQSGADYLSINPKGYVPALTLDDGETLTENVAILNWISHQDGALKPSGAMGHTHHLQTLAFISTEIHKSLKPFFTGAGDEDKRKAKDMILKRLGYLSDAMAGDYLFGDQVSAADCYLFVMLLWSQKNGIDVPDRLSAYRDRMMARPAVHKAMAHEGLF